jgi:predicted ABC-type sugar transport system permease subunit
MRTQTKIGLGSVLATAGGLGMALSLLLRWSAAPRPWGFLLGFLVGVVAGIGVALTISGMIDRRRGI